MEDDIFTLINRLRVDKLELIGFIIGLQTKYDEEKSENNWIQILNYLRDLKVDISKLELINNHYKDLKEKETFIFKKNNELNYNILNDIESIEYHTDQIVELLNRINSETKL